MFYESATFWLSAALALTVPLAIWLGFKQRMVSDKGMGWQFIRVMVITTGLPMIGLLALNSLLTGEVVTLIAAAMGFAFGKSGGANNA